MQLTTFTLYPFSHADLQVTGSITRNAAKLLVCYVLRGNLAEVLLPEPNSASGRRDALWQSTCFELFVAAAGSSCYWEINLSPSGDWNVYAFDEYRTGMREEPAFAALPFTGQRQADSFRLELDLPLTKIIRSDQELELGISAVMLDRNGQRSFHALTHCAAQPDFHQRQSFRLHLAAPSVFRPACPG